MNPQGRLTPLGPFASLDEANSVRDRTLENKAFAKYYIGEVYKTK